MMTNSFSPRLLLALLPCVFVVAMAGCEKKVASNSPVPPKVAPQTSPVRAPLKQAPPIGVAEIPAAEIQQVAFQVPEPQAKTEEGMAKWANDTFKSLKDKGLTKAADASGWLAEDFRNINGWEYKVKQIDVFNAPTTEATLNSLGEKGWECFQVQTKGNGMVMFFKKPKRSFLKSLPTTDLMRLVPMMRGE